MNGLISCARIESLPHPYPIRLHATLKRIPLPDLLTRSASAKKRKYSTSHFLSSAHRAPVNENGDESGERLGARATVPCASVKRGLLGRSAPGSAAFPEGQRLAAER